MIDVALWLGFAVLLLVVVRHKRKRELRKTDEARIKRAEADLAVEDEIRKYLEGRRWR